MSAGQGKMSGTAPGLAPEPSLTRTPALDRKGLPLMVATSDLTRLEAESTNFPLPQSVAERVRYGRGPR